MDRDAPTRLMLARAVWPYTFGIIQDGRFGCHGAAIGTGVGVSWHDRSVIITAGHNLESTPEQRQYYLLPLGELQLAGVSSELPRSGSYYSERVQLEAPDIRLGGPDGNEDFAAVVLPVSTAAHSK